MRNTIFAGFLLGLMLTNLVRAETAEEKGTKIAKEIELRNDGFIGESSKMKMVLIDAHGTSTDREMDGTVMEVPGDGNKSMSIFLAPKDVKGTKMLTWAHKNSDDEQWLYLPSLRRVKRISGKNKSASFMGSEFSYEDIGGQEVEKYNYKWIKDGKMAGQDIWVLERIPLRDSGYSKQVLYVSQKYNNALKVEYFDRKNELLKVGEFSEFKQFKVGPKTFWLANKIHMKNVQTQKQSTFTWLERKVGVKHKANYFETRNLQ